MVGNERADWGHINIADSVMSDKAAKEKYEPSIWLDSGTDHYAGVPFSDALDGRLLFVGWVITWQYANPFPTDGWRGASAVS